MLNHTTEIKEPILFTVTKSPEGTGVNGDKIKLFFAEDFGQPTMAFRFTHDGENDIMCIESLGACDSGFAYYGRNVTNNPKKIFDADKFAQIGTKVGWYITTGSIGVQNSIINALNK